MRGTVRRHVRIRRPADVVWQIVGRPELLHHWFPGIVECVVDGDQRTITTGAGLTFSERILTNDPVLRRFQYTLSGGVFQEHLATVDVIDLGDDTSLVVYSTDCRPASMALVLGGGSGGALEELRRQLESGSGPALDASTTAGAI